MTRLHCTWLAVILFYGLCDGSPAAAGRRLQVDRWGVARLEQYGKSRGPHRL